MLHWLRSFFSDIRSDFGNAMDVDGLVEPVTDVPLRLWVLNESKIESNTNSNNKWIDIGIVKVYTAIVNSGQFTQTQQA